MEDKEIEPALANVAKQLNAQQDALQEKFHRLLRASCEQTAQVLLENLYADDEIPATLAVTVSVGRSQPTQTSCATTHFAMCWIT